MYANSLSCISVKVGESECSGINSCMKQYCIMSLGFSMLIGHSDERGENGDGEGRSEISGGEERVMIS